ncbi:MAG: sulfatase-like hydrolase/transferase, partial [Verrucomicrobia bacterium]|nr:sulfatase-like hydrolase/transferase [Verrucomicrobiota bacterium]
MKTQFHFISKLSLQIILVALTGATALAGTGKPNIIYIMTDDLGYGDLGCYGQQRIKTPQIDQLAEEGMRFTDFYMAAPMCSPSRAAMMTGCYPQRIGRETGWE